MANQLTFTCPIFNVETKFAHCTELRHRIYRGEAGTIRKGCQACAASGKCPVVREVNTSIYQGMNLVEHYVSVDEPKKGKLRAQVLEAILPVVVQEQHLAKFDVSPGERDLIMTANERIRQQLGSAPRKDMKPYVDRSSRRQTPAERPKFVSSSKPAPASEPINQAAATGDLAAAINQAA